MTSYLTIWEYKIKPEMKNEFENLYGSEGAWVKLFEKFPDYIKTELHHDIKNPDRYVTIDYWKTRESYYRFKETSKREFLEIDKKGEDLTLEEKQIGEFLSFV